MTSGLKTPSSYYMNLIATFPPRPITNETELIAAQNRINSILDKGKLTQDDRDYLKVLSTLIYDYEEKYEPMPTLNGVELLKALLEELDLRPLDLVCIFESESTVLEVLNGEREIPGDRIEKLAAFFRISPHAFFK